MLAELRIRDLAIIDALDLAFGPGFNVLTGETGAGKSIIIDAVNLLLGDRASQEVVRAGAERTEVEGTFQFSAAAAERLTLPAGGARAGGRPGRPAGAGARGARQRPSVRARQRPGREQRAAGRDRRPAGRCPRPGRAPVAAARARARGPARPLRRASGAGGRGRRSGAPRARPCAASWKACARTSASAPGASTC